MATTIGDAAAGADWAWVRLDVERGRIRSASGEGAGVVELAGAVRGLAPLEACSVPGPSGADGALALDALHAALAPVVRAALSPQRVAVAMSGGVDSAVALLRARRAGLEPVGVTLRLWTDPAGADGDRACCSPSSVRAARTLCHELGVPHVTLDLREPFRAAVVRPFVESYARGETPNPCVRCNGAFRFGELMAFARRVGATTLATGHYARIVDDRGRRFLARGVDPVKDQSYMLATVPARLLARLWFPLGDARKIDVRAEAADAGLAAAGRSESQEACFLAGDDYRAFLERHGLLAMRGEIVDTRGAVLGAHDGYWRFTPGQRRGHGVASSSPLYVVETRRRDNTVVLGPRDALVRTRIGVRPGWLATDLDRSGRHVAKLRYRSPAVPATVLPRSRGFELVLEEPAIGVAVGQTAVVYDGDVVVGAGRISSARK